jgi:D-alanyl-D-alanine carboxypeptidase
MRATTPYEKRILDTLGELGIPDSFADKGGRPVHVECEDLVSIGLDMFGREQRLAPRAAAQWQAMVEAAKLDGVELVAISGFRSFDYQRKIIEKKLAAGQTIEEIVSVSALPGFSEHHTGRAIDIGTPGSPPLTEAFEQTPAFEWLTRNAHDFGFRMSYPKGNPFEVIYEPWHWFLVEKPV